jgi:hypothetical protein
MPFEKTGRSEAIALTSKEGESVVVSLSRPRPIDAANDRIIMSLKVELCKKKRK